MKSKLFVFSVILLFILPFYSFAGEGSDTIGACKILPQLRYAYTDNDFESNYPSAELLKVGRYVTHSAYLQVDMGTCDYFDIYGLIGASFIHTDAGLTMDMGGGLYYIWKQYYDPGFMFGLGIKGTFFRADNGFYVGAGALFTHLAADTEIKLTLTDPTPGIYTNKGKLIENNFYADLHVGWHFKNIGLTPYVGVEYRQVWARFKKPLFKATIDLENHHPVGVYAGLDYFINDRLYLNVEGHAIDRWGVNAGIGYLFDICGKPAPVVAPVIPESEPVLTPMR